MSAVVKLCRAILIDDTTGTDIEVTDLRVTHLPIGQTNILTVGAQFGVGVFGSHRRNIIGMDGRNDIRLVMVAVAPSVENHQKNLVTHSIYAFYI